MKRFIKDNIVLLVVLSLASMVALALLVLVMIKWSRMMTADQKVNELKGKIEELIKQSPAPVAGNIEPLKAEAKLYRDKTAELQKRFGGLRQPALDAFFKALGVEEEAFREVLRTEWEAAEDRNTPGGFNRFFQLFARGGKENMSWNLGKWSKARAEFVKLYQPLIVEEITAGNADEILFSALGVPRKFDGRGDVALRNYMWPMRAKLNDMYMAGYDGHQVELAPEAAAFGFDFNRIPKEDRIANIVKNFEVIGDMSRRIIQSKVDALRSFYIRNQEFTFAGTQSGPFVSYHYTFEVSGTMESIRALYQSLNDAAKDNRVYIVRSVYLYTTNDGASEVFFEREQKEFEKRQALVGANQNELGTTPMVIGPARRSNNQQPGMGMMQEEQQVTGPDGRQITAAQLRELEMKKPYNERTGYGRILIGGDRNCDAVFDVDYVFIAGPELN
ncbi:MAG: hypothetical protein J6R85_06500 [Lentisphaeria bacterium]|nr:hypothetical protein [Lentisphaeria bacterium]